MTAPLARLFDAAIPTRLLVVVAHPDDEAVGFGASLARIGALPRDRRAPPRLVVATDGAPRDPALRAVRFRGPREAYARARRRELARALAVVGLGDAQVTWLELTDQEAAHHLVWLAREIAALVADEAPDVVVTQPYEGGHPDHDAVAFAVHAALRIGAREGRPRPALVEMSAYHAAPGGVATETFLASQDGGDAPVATDAARDARDLEPKRLMLEAYATQADVLAAFPVAREPLRLAPAYDFGAPPHDGALHYERLGWPMTGARFRELAADADAALFAPRAPAAARARSTDAMTVLSVAYALGEVGPDAAGGAEQVLATVDRAIVERGHASIVVAVEGSRVSGELVATPAPEATVREVTWGRAWRAHADAIREVLARRAVDVVHFHGVDFLEYLPPDGPPALVTLHLPPSYYRDDAFRLARPGTWLNPVSESQRAACPPCERLLPAVPNGVDVDRLPLSARAAEHVVVVARLCPEKGIHHAVDAARRARLPIVIAGPVQPYPAHAAYFDEQIAPRLGRDCRWIGPVGGATKREVIASARALVVASSAPETSSLVAMEAIASGTPVAALRVGALAEIVEDGVTGALADDPEGLSDAITRAARLDRAACRRRGRERFDARAMTERYLALYQRLRRAHGALPASA